MLALPAPAPPPTPAVAVVDAPKDHESTSISSLCLLSVLSPSMPSMRRKKSTAIRRLSQMRGHLGKRDRGSPRCSAAAMPSARAGLRSPGRSSTVWQPERVRIVLLGPLEVQRDGLAEPPGGRRLAALLARLALDCGRVVSAGSLIDAVWDDALPGDPSHALQTLVSRLRRSLPDGVLVQEAGGYRLALDPQQVDATVFERLVAAGEFDAALALWRGPALAGLAGEYRFATAAAARLEDLKLRAQADRIGAELARGQGAALLGEIEALLAGAPARRAPCRASPDRAGGRRAPRGRAGGLRGDAPPARRGARRDPLGGAAGGARRRPARRGAARAGGAHQPPARAQQLRRARARGRRAGRAARPPPPGHARRHGRLG